MASYILKNSVRIFLLIIAVSIAAFLLMTYSPLTPLQTNIGQTALGTISQEQIEKLESYWGTNEAPLKRYLTMGKRLFYRRYGNVIALSSTCSRYYYTKIL